MAKAVTDDPVMVCVEAYAGGPGAFYREGVRLRRGSITYFSGPYWITDGSSQEDVNKAREILRGDGQPAPQDREQPKPVRMMRAIRPISHTEYNLGDSDNLRSAIFNLQTGDVLPAHHALVAKYPRCFEPVRGDSE